jgi:uncharacterized repeat protein (TIGR01451 family)
LGWALVVLATLISITPLAHAEVEPGTPINNQANAAYTIGLGSSTAQSNLHSVAVVPTATAAVMNTMMYDPADPTATIMNIPAAEYFNGVGYTSLAPPLDINSGTPIVLSTSALVNSSTYQTGEAVFIVISDPDQDLLFAVADTVVITVQSASGDTETIRLTETGPHTGVFAGYVQSGTGNATAENGVLDVGTGSGVTVTYIDPDDAADTVASSITFGSNTNTLGLYVLKSAGRKVAYLGDFILYTITVEEILGSSVDSVVLSDTMPVGMRFMDGSVTINGLKAPNPDISENGRTLSLQLGTLAPGSQTEIVYVVEIAAGIRPGVVYNYASASGTNTYSNVARASLTVRDPFWRDYNTIVGQVLINQCGSNIDDDKVEEDGLQGVRIYLEDGTFVITDKNGMYHFEGLSNDTHVVQLDLDSLPANYEIALCEENTAFAGRAYSQFVDLSGGALWRTDFHVKLKPRDKGTLKMELLSSYNEESIEYSIPLVVGSVAVKNARLTIILPKEAEYKTGSAYMGGKQLPEPSKTYSSLTFSLGDLPAGFSESVKLKTKVSEKGELKELITRATMTFNTPKQNNNRVPVLENILRRSIEDEESVRKSYLLTTNFVSGEAELHKEDVDSVKALAKQLKGLKIDQIFAIGHTDSTPLNGSGVFKDNYELSESRAKSIARYLGDLLELSPEHLSYMGSGPDNPVADNSTVTGRAKNRRVEVKVYTDLVSESYILTPTKERSGQQTVSTSGHRPGDKLSIETEDDSRFDPPKFRLVMPEYDGNWLNEAEPGFKWLWPNAGYQPFAPAVNIAIQHMRGQRVALTVNGEEVPIILFEGVLDNSDGSVSVSRWRGVSIKAGNNIFEASIKGKNFKEKITKVVHFAGAPVKAKLIPEKSRLVANGSTTPVLAVRLTDASGKPARPGLVGAYSVTAPYKAERTLEGALEGKASYVIGYDGIAYLKLMPTTKSGTVTFNMKLKGREQELRAWIDSEPRDWILVGIAEGTLGYNLLSGNAQNLKDNDIAEDFYNNGRLAFFAKGKVKGSWLLTMAYDSEKPPYSEYDQHQSLDPDAFYTLYGDNTTEDHEASTSEKLYVKIERKNFYALFGSFDTDLTLTELSRYSRSLSGFKSEYKDKNFQFNAFASETNQAFKRDEIRGDGTTGLYYISRQNIVMNSDKVTIEVRDRKRSDVIISSTPQARFVDYTINYDDGTLFFKEPVDNHDFDMNPVYIVVEYESFDSSDSSWNYGGRAAVSLRDDTIELGVTGIKEDSVGRSANLTGADATARITESTTIFAEVSQTSGETSSSSDEGNAYILKVEHDSTYLKGSAYAKYISEDFGLGHQAASEVGTRKIGFDTRIKTGGPLVYSLRANRNNYLDTGNERDLLDGDVTYSQKNQVYKTGLRRVIDRNADGTETISDQLTAGAKWFLMDRRLVLKLSREQALNSSSNENSDYPTRTTLGTEYQVSSKLSLIGVHEVSDSSANRSESTKAGVRSTPWKGGSINSTVEQKYSDESLRMFSAFGIKQTWQATKELSLSAGFDKTTTIKDSSAENVAANKDYFATSIGAKYVTDKLTLNSRAEFHESKVAIKRNAASSITLAPKRGLGISAGIHIFIHEAEEADKSRINLRVATVYRPSKSRWTVLDRADLIYEEYASDELVYDNWRIVNNFNLNYKVPHFGQLSVKYGAKYVEDTIQGKNYVGYTDLTGLEGRYNLSPIWDIGSHVDVLHSWQAGQIDTRLGVSLGYTPARNIWVSFGYNLEGFYDQDFSRSDYTMHGMFMRFRLKFDQNSSADIARWKSGH